MRVQELGEVSGEITVFGGPYSNYHALDALLARAKGTLICTGDLVAYCGAPEAVVARIQRENIVVVAGNCEKQLAARALDCGCGFEDGTSCDLLSVAWYGVANAAMDDQMRHWMGGLPDIVSFTHAGRRVAVIHGGVTDVARFIWNVSDASVFAKELDALNMLLGDVDVVIAGHSGIAFERDVHGVRWINAGVIGMPAHNGSQCTEFVTISADGEVRFETLSYDVAGAVLDMERAGLTQGYHVALQTGIWPSEDVLPLELRR